MIKIANKFKFISADKPIKDKSIKDEPFSIMGNYETLGAVRINSFTARQMYLGDQKEAIKSEVKKLVTQNLVAIKMNDMTKHKLRSAFGYELDITTQKSKVAGKVIAQLYGRPIVLDPTISDFCIQPIVRTDYSDDTDNTARNNKLKFMRQ